METNSSLSFPDRMACSTVVTEFEVNEAIVGDSVCVVLDENPSTGYGWEYRAEPEGLLELIETKSFDPEGSDPKMVGASVTTVWKFSAVSEGEVTLTYMYRRSWETDVEPIETIEYLIRIGR
ncbi:MAG: protease inhibitor I42 family protein [Deltaproteobacteria bacterium]|nr:protease inhibitor I42 family protein [Candidatus Zymogenaceae bacterium]